ncbi:hypothetical protein L2E82_39751 [Cichorium intybus]|uniref:Uncharacterized protein n=1 Tax=Cichorium intybus TaxID=13427 RepID=A0ACB9AID3_CICIN|nr:hypothetical protein L2E82_39751 [Cichorium intybus]
METTSHLERMGEELKCPICLSLLKSAVSLTCNHIFCNLCIDKSMSSDSTCPVCKIPYRRREIRPAPHMDTLVNIYKSMEVSSGVNILVTQSEHQTSGHENQVEDVNASRSKKTSKPIGKTPNTLKQRKNKGKTLKESSKKPKTHNSDSVRPSFPIKKRVQVPQHHPQETPTRPANFEGGKSELIKDRTQTNVIGLEDTAHLHENEERLFSPFFWLRNEEDTEETIEPTPTPLDPVNVSQPNAPCFSDIKDSFDDHSCHVTSKDNGNFDSEMFEWTQRPCSPELCASPVKKQDKESNGYDMVPEKEADNMEVVLPNLSPLQKVDHEVKVKGPKKRAKKVKESVQKKRVKRDKDKNETPNQQHIKRAKRSKNQDPNNSNNTITEINKTTISQFPIKSSLVDGEIKACSSTKQTVKGKVSKKLKTVKKVTFSTNEGLKGKSVDDIPRTSETVATKKCDDLSDICCAFCHSKEESDISGCMTHYLKGKPITLDHEGVPNAIHAHSNCTEWAPNVYFEDDIAINLEAELTRSKRIKCSCCGLKGAALGCYEKSCHKSFHFPCAKLTPQCRWDYDNFVMLCPLHASHKLPNETSGSQLKEKKKYVPKRQWTTARWDTHGLFTKIVICCSALTTIEKETIVEFEKLSGVTILKTWDSRVTHVIASVDENGACRRTLKYLMGIIEGKWILTFEWIKACLEVKKPVDEQRYEINLDVYGFTGGPKLGRSRLLNKEPKLFNAMKFYFTGDFVASYKGYLHDLIIAAGGTVLHRKPVKLNYEQQFLIYSLELPDKIKPDERNLVLSQRKSDAETLARSSGGVAVSNFWILNSIAACKLQELD